MKNERGRKGIAIQIKYRCISCGNEFESSEIVYRCVKCKGVEAQGFQKGNLIVECNIKPAPQKNALIDPLSFLPLPIRVSDAFKAGDTPLIVPEKLKKGTGLSNLFLKNECTNPSGSLKDRASLLVAAQAKYYNENRVVLASTGNAGSAMACAGAACGLETVLFVPETAPREKILQSILYGAKVIPIQGTYDDAFQLSIEYSTKFGGINRNTAYNPLTVEGKKTVALELYNQLGYKVPDVIYIPTGDGVIYAGVCKGFIDLKKAGLIDELPRCVMVQASGSNAIVKSWAESKEIILEKADSIADSISVASPANGEMALYYLKQTNGWGVIVSDSEILKSQRTLSSDAGLFVEPSSAAAWAGLVKDLHQKEDRRIHPDSIIVVLLTGTGFKDMKTATEFVHMPPSCPAKINAVDDYLNCIYNKYVN